MKNEKCTSARNACRMKISLVSLSTNPLNFPNIHAIVKSDTCSSLASKLLTVVLTLPRSWYSNIWNELWLSIWASTVFLACLTLVPESGLQTWVTFHYVFYKICTYYTYRSPKRRNNLQEIKLWGTRDPWCQEPKGKRILALAFRRILLCYAPMFCQWCFQEVD